MAPSRSHRKLRLHPRRLVGIGAHRHRQPAILAHGARQHFGIAVEPAQAGAVGRIERQFERQPAFAQPRLDRRDQALYPLAADRRYRDRTAFSIDVTDIVPDLDDAKA